MISPTAIAAYLAFFTVVGIGFLFVNLLVGKLVRPNAPNVEKLEVYECGEPTIGSSFVQFDLRFYVVALLFIIFDVEVAFFFPWATVFGKATQLMDPNLTTVVSASRAESKAGMQLTPAAAGMLLELGVDQPQVPNAPLDAAGKPIAVPANSTVVQQRDASLKASARRLAWLSLMDIAAFFAVLLVGFAYVWRRGDLDWVRAVSRQRAGDEDSAGAPVRPTDKLVTVG